MARLTLRKRERYGLSAKGAYISSSLDGNEIGINRRSTRHPPSCPPGRGEKRRRDNRSIASMPASPVIGLARTIMFRRPVEVG